MPWLRRVCSPYRTRAQLVIILSMWVLPMSSQMFCFRSCRRSHWRCFCSGGIFIFILPLLVRHGFNGTLQGENIYLWGKYGEDPAHYAHTLLFWVSKTTLVQNGLWSLLIGDSIQTRKSFGISETECLVVLSGFQYFAPYLTNNRFLLRTDHITLRCSSSKKH